MTVHYDDFEAWRLEAKRRGYHVHRVTATSFNTYYHAFNREGLTGHFNTWVGKKGASPDHKPLGVLNT